MRSRYRWLALALLSALLMMVVSACGSNSTSSNTSSGGGGSSSSGDAVQKEAAALVVKAEQPPATVPEAVALKSTNIPKGKKVTFLSCGTAQCEEQFTPIKEGAEALGWSAKMYPGSFEPNKIVGQLQTIVEERPDVFIAVGLSPSLGKKYFNELKANGAVTVMCCTAKPGTEGIDRLLSTPEDKLPTGAALADSFLAEQGENLHALYVTSKSFEIAGPYFEGFDDEVKRLCSACTVDTLDVAAEDIGKPVIATTVVSYLRAHPEINALVYFFSELGIGVPAAMKAAGLEIPMGSGATGPITAEAIHDGGKEFWANAMLFGKEWGLWALNIAVRKMTNEPLGDETATPELLLTTKNAAKAYEGEPSTGVPLVIKDALQQYEELWGLK